MAEIRPMVGSTLPAGHVLGRKLDSIPFSGYHVLIIAVLALVGFIEGYDLVMTGSLLVLAKGPAAPDRHRHPLARCRPDLHAVHRRLCVVDGIRSLEPQDDHADRRDRHDIFHTADPAGANRRAADHRASADRPWRRQRGLGGVPDRRRIDAGAAPPHLRGDLRDGAGRLVHGGAVHRRPARRQRIRLSVSGIAGRAGDHRRAGADLFRAPGKPALAPAQRPGRRSLSTSSI